MERMSTFLCDGFGATEVYDGSRRNFSVSRESFSCSVVFGLPEWRACLPRNQSYQHIAFKVLRPGGSIHKCRRGEWMENRDQFAAWHRFLVENCGQDGHAEVHRDIVGAVGAIDVVNGDDVQMVEGGGSLGFCTKRCLRAGLLNASWGRSLSADVPSRWLSLSQGCRTLGQSSNSLEIWRISAESYP